MNLQIRRDKKHDIAEQMIITYCKGNKHDYGEDGLCNDCRELRDYSLQRTTRCPHVEKTLFCSNCPTPCYKPDMKERMRVAMKYAGPRFFFKHPILVTKHIRYDYKTRKKDNA